MDNPPDSDAKRVQRRELFISYSRKDRAFLEQFWIHLSSLADYGLKHWDDSKIKPGDIWLEEIEQALARAQVALLLVSPDFLASTFIRRKELPTLFDAAKKDGLTILWLPIRPCSWERYPQIQQYQSVGSLEPTLSEMKEPERERAMVKITDHIHDLLEHIQLNQLAAEKIAAAEALANAQDEARRRDDQEHKEALRKDEALQKQEKNDRLQHLETKKEAQAEAVRLGSKFQLPEKERKDSQRTTKSAASQPSSRPPTSSPHPPSPINITSSKNSRQDQSFSSSAHAVQSLESMAMLRLGDRMQRPLSYTPACPIILMDTKMPAILGIDSSELVLYMNSTMKSVRFDKMLLQQDHQGDIVDIAPEDIFLPELHLVRGQHSLINSWLSQIFDGNLSINGESVSPLLPLKPIVREIFSSAELYNMCSIDLIPYKDGMDLQITLRIPLHGSLSSYPVIQRYPVKSENLINEDLPVIAIWPNISDITWRHYVIFAEERNLSLSVDGFSDYSSQSGGEHDECVRYFFHERFPDFIKLTERSQYRGLIPVNPPPLSDNVSRTWFVGIDFGTSVTNFFINDGSGPARKSLESMVISLTLADSESQLHLLCKYFIPETLLPKDANPPTSTALNTYGWQELPGTVPEPFHQVRVQWPSSNGSVLRGSAVRSGFKWGQLQYQRPFLKALALLISSNASAAGATSVEWAVSYPSAFSPNESKSYQRLWKDLCTELSALTGLKQHISADRGEGGFQTQAVAFASYFGNSRASQMVHTACLYVGGSTTDISIWQDNTLLHQVSVPFAGRDICTRILHYKPSFISVLFPSHTATITSKVAELRQDPNFSSWFDNILRIGSPYFLAETMPILRNEKHPQLIHFVSLMAISFAGIYHYLGIILAALAQEKLLKKSTPMEVCLGGNGANFLHWLDEGGAFYNGSDSDLLLSALQCKSTEFSSQNKRPVGTTISDAIGDEVACGLLSKGIRLSANLETQDDMITGEELVINTLVFKSLDRVVMPPEVKTVKEHSLGSFDEIKRFVSNYDAAIAELRINSILPIHKLCNMDHLWYDVECEVRSICLQWEGKEIFDFHGVPGFIIALRGLSKVLAKRWCDRH